MRGNVAEWCHDSYQANYYASSPARDPRGPDMGAKRVIRGGAWNAEPASCRLTARRADDPGISDACFARDTHGFRCVRRADGAK
jgi:formylglycine-generating enzyme required for sulfatase activity